MDSSSVQAQSPMPKAAGLSSLAGPKQVPQLTIVRVENGFLISPPYYGGDQKVAMLLNDMLDIVKAYFEDRPEQQQ
jgi:hypothetical protein